MKLGTAILLPILFASSVALAQGQQNEINEINTQFQLGKTIQELAQERAKEYTMQMREKALADFWKKYVAGLVKPALAVAPHGAKK